MKKPKVKTAPKKFPYDNSVLFALLIFGLLAMIFFKDTLFLGMQYGAPDTTASGSNSAPLLQHYKATGKIPLWAPYIFCGMPAYGSTIFSPDAYFAGIFIDNLFNLPGLFYLSLIIYFGYKAWPKSEKQSVVTALVLWLVVTVVSYMANFMFDGYEIFTSIKAAVTNVFWATMIAVLCRFVATYRDWTWKKSVLCASLNYLVIYFLILPT